MKTIVKGNFVFLADIEKTERYYANNSLCDCSSCRNLRAQIETVSPQLAKFLSEFGIDICRPDEAADVEMEDYIDYLFVGYTVTGSIETEGRYDTVIGNIHITISKGDTPYDWFPNEQTDPCFFVSVTGISLPWILDEPFPRLNEPVPRSERIIDKIKRFFVKK